MQLIEKAMLFTEITLEECATVSGGCDTGNQCSNSDSNAIATVNIIINPSSTSNTPTPTTTATTSPAFTRPVFNPLGFK